MKRKSIFNRENDVRVPSDSFDFFSNNCVLSTYITDKIIMVWKVQYGKNN